MTWKQHAAVGLEVATRHHALRRLARRVTSAGFAPSGALPFMHIDKQFAVTIPGSKQAFDYEGTDADAVARHLFWTGLSRWEAESWREFIPLAQRARWFVDVGAFTGAYSLVAATVNPSVNVVAFEPVPEVYRCLKRNVELNDLESRVQSVNAAVSDAVGTARFFIPDREMPDTSFLSTSARQPVESGRWHDVPTTTLAATLPSDARVDLMKVDVEDAEGPVISAMSGVISRDRPTILVEFLTSGTYLEAFRLLSQLDYDFYHLTGTGRISVSEPVPDDVFFNFLCVPRT